jgi:hypothetical protein
MAYQQEEALISSYGRLHEDGPLTNRSPGGGSINGRSPFSQKRHRNTLGGIPDDDPETATLNAFVLDIAQMRSVVLKPVSRFRARPTQRYPTKSIGLSLRQAAAVAASASANGIPLDEAADVPRKVTIDGVAAFVENGVCCDILTSGLAQVIPGDPPENEMFRLSREQSRLVVGMIGHRKAVDLGLLPESKG